MMTLAYLGMGREKHQVMTEDDELEVWRARTTMKEQSIFSQWHEPHPSAQTQTGRCAAITWRGSWPWKKRTSRMLWSTTDWQRRHRRDQLWKRQSQPQGRIKQWRLREGSQASSSPVATLLAMPHTPLVTNVQISWIRPEAGMGEGCQGDSRKGKPVLQRNSVAGFFDWVKHRLRRGTY